MWKDTGGTCNRGLSRIPIAFGETRERCVTRTTEPAKLVIIQPANTYARYNALVLSRIAIARCTRVLRTCLFPPVRISSAARNRSPVLVPVNRPMMTITRTMSSHDSFCGSHRWHARARSQNFQSDFCNDIFHIPRIFYEFTPFPRSPFDISSSETAWWFLQIINPVDCIFEAKIK